ncbi:MAG: 30S ribosomal protein S24e [Candidatus Altiarchaeia archaeon]|jgi:small subunit ribosomal protein S24e
MKIQILKEKENKLLNRKEIDFKVAYDAATPKIGDVRKELIAALHSKENLTIIDSLKSGFGSKSVKGYAKVYKDEESLKIEPAHRMKKNSLLKEEKKDDAAAASAEKKEEKK